MRTGDDCARVPACIDADHEVHRPGRQYALVPVRLSVVTVAPEADEVVRQRSSQCVMTKPLFHTAGLSEARRFDFEGIEVGSHCAVYRDWQSTPVARSA